MEFQDVLQEHYVGLQSLCQRAVTHVVGCLSNTRMIPVLPVQMRARPIIDELYATGPGNEHDFSRFACYNYFKVINVSVVLLGVHESIKG